MENRKESLSALKLCRFCLTQDAPLESLYDINPRTKNSVNLPLKILSCVSVEVFPSDKMPTFICNRCKFFMNLFYDYKNITRQADQTILKYVQNGTPLESTRWPVSLNKVFRSCGEVKIVKTIVEGGATVQVTSQEQSDSDEDDANVYNIKIGDGPDDGTRTACIKVVTSNNSSEIQEDSNTRGKEEDEESDRAEKGEGCWPCDECDRTYSLQQLLELHKQQKHRARNVECDQCDAKFYTKYDLATHQIRHSDDAPFQCVVCGKKFKRLILLKRHERMVHSDMPQQKCPYCPATFISLEQLEAHQKKHIRVNRTFNCEQCDKKFQEKTSLQRHLDSVHGKSTFNCQYCPERFGSLTKLTRHVRTHAGDRPHPCKYCEKSFVKSHHYTRHLRVKHREELRSSFGAREVFRCEQCGDAFGSQDDLIYHSAIHATQDLTCPLCQEKFHDVEAVTAHIKSHVNGVEFMCDYCELVFITKEKLDNHLAMAHEDEINNELGQDGSAAEMEAEEDEDDDGLNVKEEDDHMVIEIKKADNYMINNAKDDELEEKMDNTNSEESEIDATELPADPIAISSQRSPVKEVPPPKPISPVPKSPPAPVEIPAKVIEKADDSQTASILRKAEDIKRKLSQQQMTAETEKKEKPVQKVENSNTGGASDKSLRLLEKELQDLKRTNSRTEINKTPMKVTETTRNKRPQLYSSTPKPRAIEEKKSVVVSKPPALERKQPERRTVTKENKEPKEIKEVKSSNGNNKEEKEIKETPKNQSVIKNGANEKNTEESVRRSTRPSKIKDYAKMIRDRAQESDDDTSDDDEEYRDTERESRQRSRRASQTPKPAQKSSPATPASAPTTPASSTTPAMVRKRGRPRKEAKGDVPSKIKKEDNEANDESKDDAAESQESSDKDKVDTKTSTKANESNQNDKPTTPEHKAPDVLVSPTGQTLKKVPVKALPPGVKPLPLPINARPVGAGELCEMQIGKKMVKVQKIVMTKAEVEAMAKKGLVEMKDGTMVLKQGIKLPSTQDPSTIKSLIKDETAKESLVKKERGAPTRCDISE